MTNGIMRNQEDEIENLAIKLHDWYLEACKRINPENFNLKAQKIYKELTEEQKFIDRYIAEKIIIYRYKEELCQGNPTRQGYAGKK